MDIYIFNELSSPFATITEAKEHLVTFINICFRARKLGFKTLHLHENIGKSLYELPIAPNYTVSQWLQDSEEDVKNQFREIITKTPLITKDYPIEKERNELSEFKIEINHKTQFADGLGAAYLLETLCVSFLSHDLWNTDEIKNVKHWCLTEAGNELTEIIAVKHASKPAHLAKHQAWFEQKKRENLQKSRDLWELRYEFFPHLVLCGEVEKQLTRLGIQSKFFDQIIEKLKRLNEYAKNWQNGSYSDTKAKQYGLDVSGESEGTLKKYGRQRKFRLPNKKKQLFEKHIKTGNLRFHFYPDEESHTIYVGYIGSHLSTVKFK
ncbi:MAG: hypothetical protein DRQ49_12410 [Gammaproteobacteria bacterium]|nr:MAG: hypothetical protein DRQ49_12410 [Gammaproteobacteria bacterium]RKZ41629.1 MAG: hypothetical protein DRQ41_08055 [Gammaproteobacteria bacterium]RKZ73446.1 MAG: hypothetical protein DRQ57_14340 [Gammaproteobacteria bacterium]